LNKELCIKVGYRNNSVTTLVLPLHLPTLGKKRRSGQDL
jgi:hypothetical protein